MENVLISSHCFIVGDVYGVVTSRKVRSEHYILNFIMLLEKMMANGYTISELLLLGTAHGFV